ncbi:hypothetical protein GF406_19410 [candidate division KSB1 bacterium]|nr:hypothetical protein [candidate division KSB1 bacterium]
MKRFSFILIFFVCLIWQHGYAQTELVWQDGDPSFNETTLLTDGILLNSVISLEPIVVLSGFEDERDLKLFGLDWSWPRSKVQVISAKDIDYRQVGGGQYLYLITDALANAVFEFNPVSDEVVWTFGSAIQSDPDYLDRPVDSYLFKENDFFKVLITDQGHNRVLKVDKESQSVDWFYGDANGKEGSQEGQLNGPVDAVKIPDANEYVIADKGNNRVIVVNESKNVIWEMGSDELNSPVDVDYEPSNAKILITDQGNHRIMLVDRDTQSIDWQFGIKGTPGNTDSTTSSPIDADLLANGNILITDAGNNRLIEVNAAGDIVWRFSRQLLALQEADRLPDGHHLIINDIYPSGIGYADSLIALEETDLGENRNAIFDRIFWQGDTEAGTTDIWFQIRSANSLGELRAAAWMGPDGVDTFYETSGAQINSSQHRGHRLYQLRAYLRTNDPLQTPTLQKTWIEYHYYNINQSVRFRSPDLPLETGAFLPKWDRMVLNTILPEDPVDRDKVRLEFFIKRSATDETLASFSASQTLEETVELLSDYTSLNRAERIYIECKATTFSSYITPILDSWEIYWRNIPASTSGINFVKRNGNNAEIYRTVTTLPAQEDKVDSVRVLLIDPDLEAFQSSYDINVRSVKSNDSTTITLNIRPSGGFINDRPVPLRIAESVDPTNRILEVFDRDTLLVTYLDVDDPEDSSADTVMIVQNTPGRLELTNKTGDPLTTISHGQSLYLHILEENDRNIHPIQQDEITVRVYDNATGDEEIVTLYEESSGDNVYNSGDFHSENGLLVVNSNNGVRNDGKIQALAGHIITTEYVDNVTLIQTVKVPEEEPRPPMDMDLGGLPYGIFVAPNPFYTNRFDNFRLRVVNTEGELTLRYVEIFNLAGELVQEIPVEEISFDRAFPISNSYTDADFFWNLLSESGHQVASGTYFIKAHASLILPDTGSVQAVTFLKKFVVVR